MPRRGALRSGFVRPSLEQSNANNQARRELRRLFDAPQPDPVHRYLPKRYRSTDRTKRHRLPDDESKDEDVVAYKRRPPH